MSDMEKIIEQTNKIKKALSDLEEELKEMKITATDANDLIQVTTNGKAEVLDIEKLPEDFSPELKKALIEAYNNARKKTNSYQAQRKKSIVGDLDLSDIPGIL